MESLLQRANAQFASQAIVFDPPSNVRATPNGTLICSVTSQRNINIYGSTNQWYKTDACGKIGYIHQSQIQLTSNSGIKQQIKQAVLSELNAETTNPSFRIQFREITVVDNYAIASWLQGERGGSAIAVKQDNSWHITATFGDDWGGIQRFVDNGIPYPIAEKLLNQAYPGWRQWEP